MADGDTRHGNGSIRGSGEAAIFRFTTHYLDHPHQGDTQVLGGWSYVWAALFGPFYVLAKGFTRRALIMAVYTALIAAAAFAAIAFIAVAASSVGATVLGIVAVLALALSLQGRLAVRLVLIGYLKIGYREGYY